MTERPPLPKPQQRVLDDAGLEAEPEAEGWGLRNLTDAQLGLVRELPSIVALVLFETCERGAVTDAGLAALARLKTLRQLDLGPGITDAGLAHVAGLIGLRRLRVDSANGITDAGMSHLRRLTALESLSVQYTHIGDQGLRAIRHLGSLRDLEINNTRVTDDGLAQLANLTSLVRLHAGGGSGLDPETGRPRTGAVTDRGLRHLAPLRSLEQLSLDGAAAGEITSDGVNSLAHLSELRLLLLRGPGIDEACLPTLAAFPKLERLALTDTGISKAATARLQVALPACRISRTNVSEIDLGAFLR